jgi:hypothetical protein
MLPEPHAPHQAPGATRKPSIRDEAHCLSEPTADECGCGRQIRHRVADCPGIHVCPILPAAVDTLIYQKAANHFDREVRSIAPAYQVQRAVKVVVRAAYEATVSDWRTMDSSSGTRRCQTA